MDANISEKSCAVLDLDATLVNVFGHKSNWNNVTLETRKKNNRVIAVDEDTVAFLEDSDRASGIELLTDYRGERIRAPAFWSTSPESKERMQQALEYNCELAGI